MEILKQRYFIIGDLSNLEKVLVGLDIQPT
jgi:hypothetical protein